MALYLPQTKPRDRKVSKAMPIAASDELIRLPDVEAIVGLRRSRIYRMLSDPDGGFPKPAKIGSSSRWSKREVHEWIAARLAERSAPQAA